MTFRLGRIPVTMPWSGLVGIGLVAFLWLDTFDLDPGQPTQTWMLAVVFALLFYLSILGHELAHAWVARASGYPVHSITLWVLGGYTSYERRTASPLREGLIAASGPVMTLLIGGACHIAAGSDAITDPRIYVVLDALAVSNIFLGIYNALPGLPLDGGGVLKAIVWAATGDEQGATVVAAWVGRVVAVLVVVVPFAIIASRGARPDLMSVAFTVLVAAWLWQGASSALARARVVRRLPGLTAQSLTRPVILVPHDLPLSEALRRLGESGVADIVVLDGSGRPAAVAQPAAIAAVPAERRPWVPVSSVSAAVDDRAFVPEGVGGEELLAAMSRITVPDYVVVGPAGQVIGLLASADVERALGG